MRWLAKRFKYTRELEESNRTLRCWNEDCEIVNRLMDMIIDDYREREVRFNRLTIDEAEMLLSAAVDYQRALNSLAAADPIQGRILHIFEKYDIKVKRNTYGDIPFKTYVETLP